MAYDGTLKFDTAIDTSKFQAGMHKLTSIVKDLDVFKMIEKGMQLVTSSIDLAVTRYDTLNRFSPIMRQMGYSAQSAKASIQALSDGIQGLPTTLDDIVGSTQRLAIATGGLNSGTDSALALNNALIASGATAEAASRGTEQYIQALSRGKIEAEEWKTLMETMPYAMQEIATAFGFTGTGAIQDLRAAMGEGEITVVQFNEKLIELNSSVGGFAEVAQTASGGIGTAFTNMRTQIAAGVAEIISAIDSGLSETRFQSIENIINSASVAMKDGLTDLAGVVEFLMANLDALAVSAVGVGTAFAAYKAIEAWNTAANAAWKSSILLKEANGTLSLSIDKVTVANAANYATEARNIAIAAKATAAKQAQYAQQLKAIAASAKETAARTLGTLKAEAETRATEAAILAKKAQKAATLANTQARAANIVATNAETAAQATANAQMGLGTALVGYLTGSITLQTLATAAAAAATNLFDMALRALPLVGIAAVIGTVVAGVIALGKSMSEADTPINRQRDAVEALGEAYDELQQKTQESAGAYAEQRGTLMAQERSTMTTAAALRALSAEESKSGDQKKRMTALVGTLNDAYDGLNLTYDETADVLSMTTQELEEYLVALATVDQYNADIERRKELLREQWEIESNLADVAKRRAEIEASKSFWDTGFDVLNRTFLLSDLQKQETDYTEELAKNLAERDEINGRMADSSVESSQKTVDALDAKAKAETDAVQATKQAQEAAAQAAEENLQRVVDAYYNMESKISDYQSLSLDKRIENMQSNQQTMEQYAENLKQLGPMVGKEMTAGFYQELQNGSTEAVALTQQIVDSIASGDGKWEELKELLQNNVGSALGAISEAQYFEEGAGPGASIVEQFTQNIVSNQPTLDTALSEMAAHTVTQLSTAISETDFNQVGKELMEKMASGVEANQSELDTAAQAAIDKTKSAADAQVAACDFPSVGVQIARRIAQGVTSGAGLIAAAVRTAVDTAVAAAGGGSGGGGGAAGGGSGSPAPRMASAPMGRSALAGIAGAPVTDFGAPVGAVSFVAMRAQQTLDAAMDGLAAVAGLRLAGLPQAAPLSLQGLRPGVLSAGAQLALAAGTPRGGAVSAASGPVYHTNLYQTVNTHDSLSPSELAREGEDFLERAKWRIP